MSNLPEPSYEPVRTDFPDDDILFATEEDEKGRTWTLFFDGALNDRGTGIGIVLLSPEGRLIPKATQLAFPATNNVAEYEAFITGITAAQQLDATCIKAIRS